MEIMLKNLLNRYKNFDYSTYENSNIVYKEILFELNKYEKNNKGIKKIIH